MELFSVASLMVDIIYCYVDVIISLSLSIVSLPCTLLTLNTSQIA